VLNQPNKKTEVGSGLKIIYFWSFSISIVNCFALSIIYEYRTYFDASLLHCQCIMAVFYLWEKVNCLRKREMTKMGMYEYTNIYLCIMR